MLWIIILGCVVHSTYGVSSENITNFDGPDQPVAAKLIGIAVHVPPETKLRYEMARVLNNTLAPLNFSTVRAAINSHLKNANFSGRTQSPRRNETRINANQRSTQEKPKTGSAKASETELVPMETILVPQVVADPRYDPSPGDAAYPDKPHRQTIQDNAIQDFGPYFPGTFAPIPTADVWVPRPTGMPRSITPVDTKCRGRIGYVADLEHGCQTFFNCLPDGSYDKLSCPAGLMFDQDTLSCQKAHTVVCSAENIFDCAGKTGFYADPFSSDRSSYFFCINGEKSHFKCPDGLFFNENCGACDLPQNCGPAAPASYMLSGPLFSRDRPSSQANVPSTSNKQLANNQQIPSRNGNIIQQGSFPHSSDVAPTAAADQLTATPINARSQDPLSRGNSNGINFQGPDEFDCSGRYGLFADISSGCTSYWVCMPNGLKHLLQCPAHLRFNELLGACDWPDRVSCSSLMVGGGFCADKIGFYPDPNSNCKSYYFCSAEGRTYNFTCPGVLLYNEVNGACDDPQNVHCLTARMLDGFDCAGKMGLFADVAQGCRVYYSCNAYGKKTRLQCPQGQIFNERSGICDMERTVLCGPDGSTTAFDMGNALDSRSITHMTANTIPNFNVQTPPTITLFGSPPIGHSGHEEAGAFTDMRDRQQHGPPGNMPQPNLPSVLSPLPVDVPHQEQIIPVDNFRPKERPNFNVPDGFGPPGQNNRPIDNGPQADIPSRNNFPAEFIPLHNLNSQPNPNNFDRPQNEGSFPQGEQQQNFQGMFSPPRQQDGNIPHVPSHPENQQRPFVPERPVNPERQPIADQAPNFPPGQPNIVSHSDTPQRPLNQDFPNFAGGQSNNGFNQGDQPIRDTMFNTMFNLGQPNREAQPNTVFNQPPPNPIPNQPLPNRESVFNGNSGDLQHQNQNQNPINPINAPAAPGPGAQANNGPFQPGNIPINDQPHLGIQANNAGSGSAQNNNFPPNQQQPVFQGNTAPQPSFNINDRPPQPQQNIPNPIDFSGRIPITNHENGDKPNIPISFPPGHQNQQSAEIESSRFPMNNNNNNNNQNGPQLAQPNTFPINSGPQIDDINSVGIPNRAFGISPPIGAGYSAEQQPSIQNNYRPNTGYGVAQPNTAAGLGGVQPVRPEGGHSYQPNNRPEGQNSGYAQPNTVGGYRPPQGGYGQAQPNTAVGITNIQPQPAPAYNNNPTPDAGKNYGGDHGYNMGVNQENYFNVNAQQGHIPDSNQYGDAHFDGGLNQNGGNQNGGNVDYNNQEPQRPVINAATGYFASVPQSAAGGYGQTNNGGYGEGGGGGGYGMQNSANQNEFSCRGLIGYYPDLNADCRVYYYCKADGSKFQFRCPADLRYNATIGVCDWSRNVNCQMQRPGPGNIPTWNESPFFDCQGRTGFFGDSAREYRVFYYCERDGRKHRFVCPSNLRFNDARAACDWPENIFKGPYVGEQEFDCSGKRGYFGNPNTPSVYYFCEQDGTAKKFVCSDRLIFNFQIGSCDWPERLNMNNNGFMDGVSPMYRSDLPGDGLHTQGKEAAIGMSITPMDAQGSHLQTSLLKSPLSKNTFQCTPGKYGFFSDVTTNCQKYFYCRVDGKNFSFSCPNNLRFNEKLGACDLERNVPCIASGSPGFAQLAVQKTFFDCKGKTGLLPDLEEKCRTFFNCEPDGSFVTFACSDGLLFNSLIGACDRADSVQCKTKSLNQTLNWKLGM
ncbi:uncharacterized protein LOC129588682 [Paramacrobiotus metropolitanus]|uniref:uncharacterized protein LOC129588682 n=1 Tax=Paramacrobiotus metropolitanus TaxID=2943436 RepID=UPI0024465BE8|nr:uncharacterized protein LOC129588682 [Paramacrobiotus metropolitanus]